MPKDRRVVRPTKRAEFDLEFASTQAERGWCDLCSTIRNAMADAWDFLTRTPHERTPLNQPMKGELAHLMRDGSRHDRWQLKPTAQGDARIWFWVQGQTVHLETVHTRHPNQTK